MSEAWQQLKRTTPWWLRIAAKIALSRLPLPYQFWKRLRLFEHGDMDDPEKALRTFIIHARTAGIFDGARLKIRPGEDFGFLELGPGDTLFTAFIANVLGATRSWLVDSGAFAAREVGAYQRLGDFLRAQGYEAPSFDPESDIHERLRQVHGAYLTESVCSLKQIPDSSVDFCFSNAVLEHVRKSEFEALVVESRRIVKPGGVCVHRVDLKDHLGGGLNNLRFSETIWEHPLFQSSGFYTNRIRFTEMISLFQQTGFQCDVPRVARWERLPIKRDALAERFRSMPDSELTVSGFDAVLRRRGDD
ncbi:methyltransferase domain-containing protein [Methylocapsa acidiphila]|uniref:methyltransferase domain-containing protein n=1 Tax=Methylocapsa acidiphila TaxID=133552 RepID=UPI00047E6F97|nr:methyltransferase domain-containing protein [Methylocapsa acidiphila]